MSWHLWQMTDTPCLSSLGRAVKVGGRNGENGSAKLMRHVMSENQGK
jgi:hypothetical protein